jgi:hypothetical protein
MKKNTLILACVGMTLATAVGALGATPGSLLTASGQVAGTVTVTSSTPGGCPTRVCTTNMVTFSHCFTNWVWKQVCTTNSAGMVQCTNVPTQVVHCYTNTFPEITCTNEFQSPSRAELSEQLSGPLSAIAGCDELFGMFPTNSTFNAVLHLDVRTNDWVGTESGSFKIVSGTNVLAVGSLTGVTGLGTPVAGGPCGVCNHFEGTLYGAVLPAGPVPGARIQAAYAGDLTGVTCPATNAPAGAATLLINGVATTPCFTAFSGFDGDFDLRKAAPLQN